MTDAAAPLDMPTMQRMAGEASAFLKSLANPERLLLLCQLSHGACCVSELEGVLGIRQPTLSQQLAVLRDENLVTTRREGKLVYYSVSSPNALAILNLLCSQFMTNKESRK